MPRKKNGNIFEGFKISERLDAVPWHSYERPTEIAFDEMELTPQEEQAWRNLDIRGQATERFDWNVGV